ncbi:MAG: hypothetical protein IKF96_05675 [Eggerthellaceae bacterium]|nr:hypothetical protein [Eggerthellaceae bacterium]
MWSEPTKRAIIASAGLSLSLAFFMPPFPLSRFTPMQVLYPLWYEALFLFLLIVTVLAIALRKPCERLILHHPGAASVAFACAALGSLALLVLPVPVGTATVTFIILLLAVGSVGSFLIWTYTISSFDERTALVVLIAGQAVSSLLCLFLALLAISTTATLVAGILVPTLSGTL